MFSRFIDLVTKYPLWIFGGVAAVVLLIWFSSGSSSSGTPTIVSVGPSDQTVAANAMIEATRLENQRAGAANVAAVELAGIQADSYALFLGTSRDIREIDADAAVSLANVNSDMNTSLASIVTGAQTTQTGLIVEGTKDLATIDKGRQIDLANISAALRKEEIAGANAASVAAANAAVTIEQIRASNEQSITAQKLNSASWWWLPNQDTLAAAVGTPGVLPDYTNINIGMGGNVGGVAS